MALSISEEVIIFIGGASLPVIGFIGTLVLNYYWLKTPRLGAYVKIINQSASKPKDGRIDLLFRGNLEVYNQS